MDYAVIPLAGTQLLVSVGDKLKVNRVSHSEGEVFEVIPLLVSENKELEVGLPQVDSYKVALEVIEHTKDDKLYVHRFKSKSRYRRKRGHRQPISIIEVKDIVKKRGKAEAKVEKDTSDKVAQDESDEFSRLEVSTRTKNALEQAGETDLSKLRKMSKEELMEIKGIGEKGADEIITKLK